MDECSGPRERERRRKKEAVRETETIEIYYSVNDRIVSFVFTYLNAVSSGTCSFACRMCRMKMQNAVRLLEGKVKMNSYTSTLVVRE